MWAFAVGPAIAAGVMLAVFNWQRTAVRLHRLQKAVAPSGINARKTRSASQPSDATSGAAAPPPAEVHRFDESANWIRRIAARPPVRDAVAAVLQRELQAALERQLADLVAKSRGWVTHTAVRTSVKGLIPDLDPCCCDDEVNGASWVELRAGCECTGTVEVDMEIALLRDATLPISFTLSELRIAGAVARLHTDGAAAGNVDVLESPDICFELHTNIGHVGAWLSAKDIAVVPIALEWAGKRAARAIVGAVFHRALTTIVERFLPESIRSAAKTPQQRPAGAGVSPA